MRWIDATHTLVITELRGSRRFWSEIGGVLKYSHRVEQVGSTLAALKRLQKQEQKLMWLFSLM